MNLAPFDMDRQNSGINPGSAYGVSHESDNDTLKVFVRGSVPLSEVTAHVTRFQDVWIAHSKILWDLREFDPSEVTSSDILNIQHAFAEIMALRAGSRSAVLIGKELDLVARITLALSENQDGSIQLRTFLDETQSLSWLGAVASGEEST